MRIRFSTCAVLAMCGCATVPLSSSRAETKPVVPSGVIATVNGVPILKSTIDDHLWRETGSVTLDFMVKSSIIRAEAAKRGIAVSQDDIQARMLEYKTAFLTAVGHTPRDWDDFVARFGLKLIEAQQTDNLLAIRIGDDEAAKTVLSPADTARVMADLERAAHKAHGRMVFVGVGTEFDGRTDAAAKARAETVRAKLAGGASWDEVCLSDSDDVSTRPHAGDLGFVTRDQVEKPLEDFLFSATPGPASLQVVRLGNGYAVVELIERQDNPPTDAQKKTALDDVLKRKKEIAKEVSTWFPVAEKSFPVVKTLPYRQ